MAEYTIEVRTLVQRKYPFAMNDYPIFDEMYREELNNKILQHFWYREIGQETPDRFNRMLRRKMFEIMPYYNQLYKSTLLEFDPLASEYVQGGNKVGVKSSEDMGMHYGAHSTDSTGDVFTSNRDLTQKTGLEGTQDYTSNANYSKDGDKTSKETMIRTEDLNEKKDSTEGVTQDETRNTTYDEKTIHDQDEEHKENTTDKTVTDSEEDYTGSSNTTGNKMHTDNITDIGSKDSKFSDIPQAMNVEEVEDENGNTVEVSGYLTTRTVDNTVNNRTDIGNENWTENVTQQHNQTNDTTTDYTHEKTNTDKIDYTNQKNSDELVIDKLTRDTDYNHTVDNDNTINQITDYTENWHEEGESAQADNTKIKQNTVLGENEKNDTERNIANTHDEASKRSEQKKAESETEAQHYTTGRRGVSPAKLIQEWRSIFINVDMMILEELEPLFMQVW